MLDQKKIAYVAHELPTAKLGAREAAAYLGVSPGQVYKTIVALRPDGGRPVLALVDGLSEVNLKALAVTTGNKKLSLATQKEAESRTGLLVGGISPLALLQKGFDVAIDSAVLASDQVYISGGQRGLNIQIAPQDLIQLTKATLGPISRPEAQP